MNLNDELKIKKKYAILKANGRAGQSWALQKREKVVNNMMCFVLVGAPRVWMGAGKRGLKKKGRVRSKRVGETCECKRN